MLIDTYAFFMIPLLRLSETFAYREVTLTRNVYPILSAALAVWLASNPPNIDMFPFLLSRFRQVIYSN